MGLSIKRDAVDKRVLKSVVEGSVTYKQGIIDSQEDVGGWPILRTKKAGKDTDNDGIPNKWERKLKLDCKVKDAHLSTLDKNYSNIEIYANLLIESK